MSTATFGDFLVTLLSIALPAIAILPALYGSKFIRTLGRKNMILYSLRRANRDFDKFYNDKVSSPSPFYLIIPLLIMDFLAVISLFVVNLGTYVYENMVIFTVLAFTVISISSFVSYFNIDRYKKSSTAETFEKKVVEFKKRWRQLAVLWVIVGTSYIIPAMNFEGYYGFFLSYTLQNFIWVAIPLLLAFLSIIFFFSAGFQSIDLTWELINKKLAEKSLLPEIDLYVRGLDGKLDIINGFIINLGKYVQLETKKTFEILKYADIQRISSPKDNK